MHQGWPKFVQNLWYATPEGGLAALVYGPCEVQFKVADGVEVQITEHTDFPFEETVRFQIRPERAVEFSLRLRVPAWATATELRLNGESLAPQPGQRLLRLRRTWRPDDQLEIAFSTRTRTSRWMENSVAVERGPLVYALRIEEEWRKTRGTDAYGDYFEVLPKSPWNYGLLAAAIASPQTGFEVVRRTGRTAYPWRHQGAPLEMRTRGKRIPEWELYHHRAGPLPHSRPLLHLAEQPAEDIVLLPYGCTRLRITEFPVVK
jgi:hypothetical protein